jgi:hypothetical protein
LLLGSGWNSTDVSAGVEVRLATSSQNYIILLKTSISGTFHHSAVTRHFGDLTRYVRYNQTPRDIPRECPQLHRNCRNAVEAEKLRNLKGVNDIM